MSRRSSGKLSRSTATRTPASPAAMVADSAALLQRFHNDPARLSPQDVIQLQRTVGNRAVQRFFTWQPENGEIGNDVSFPQQVKGDRECLNERRDAARLESPARPAFKVADSGELAIQNTTLMAEEAKTFFATAEQIERSNEILKANHSEYELQKHNASIRVPTLGGRARETLQQVTARRGMEAKAKRVEDAVGQMNGPSNCNQMVESATGNRGPKMMSMLGEGVPIHDMDIVTMSHVQHLIRAQKGETAPMPSKDEIVRVTVPVFKVEGLHWLMLAEEAKQHPASQRGGFMVRSIGGNDRSARIAVQYLDAEKQPLNQTAAQTLVDELVVRTAARDPKGSRGAVEYLKDEPNTPVSLRPDTAPWYNDIYTKYSEMVNPDARKLGINEYASPGVGGGFVITPADQRMGKQYEAPYHWAGVVAKSGDDVITLENYARPGGANAKDPRVFFAMYGPHQKREAGAGDTRDAWKEGTFHGAWNKVFGGSEGALTLAFNPAAVPERQEREAGCVMM